MDVQIPYLELFTTIIANTVVAILGAAPSLSFGYVLGSTINALYAGIRGFQSHGQDSVVPENTDSKDDGSRAGIIGFAVFGSAVGYYAASVYAYLAFDEEFIWEAVLRGNISVLGVQIGVLVCAATVFVPLRWLGK